MLLPKGYDTFDLFDYNDWTEIELQFKPENWINNSFSRCLFS